MNFFDRNHFLGPEGTYLTKVKENSTEVHGENQEISSIKINVNQTHILLKRICS